MWIGGSQQFSGMEVMSLVERHAQVFLFWVKGGHDGILEFRILISTSKQFLPDLFT